MPCDSKPFQENQTLAERKQQVSETVQELGRLLAAGKVKPVIGSTGGIAFDGWKDRAGVTDACAYRRIMATGSALAKTAIARAEQVSGRTVNRQAIAQGLHSHDQGRSWHNGH